MPSLGESRRQVKEGLDKHATDVDHDAILAGLQDEIDRHNAVKDDLRSSMRKTKRPCYSRATDELGNSTEFRFKGSKNESHKRRKHGKDDRERRSRKRERKEDQIAEELDDTSHPFPREPIDIDSPDLNSNDAFRASLFDALADDEGAAYWESVYSQPIHVYPRPPKGPANGHLEEMSDAEYVDYVKTKMWEKKHPEIVYERRQKERERKLEEEERTRRREEFVRRREQPAWERCQKSGFRNFGKDEDGRREYEFTGGANSGPEKWQARSREQEAEYVAAWTKYLAAWDALKYDLLTEQQNSTSPSVVEPSKRIPWPVLARKPVVKANIEHFMQRAPAEGDGSAMKVLKSERVKWHPDKVQQRFGGKVDEGTMKVIIGVFQVVDAMVETERNRGKG